MMVQRSVVARVACIRLRVYWKCIKVERWAVIPQLLRIRNICLRKADSIRPRRPRFAGGVTHGLTLLLPVR
jgi:hypothetical protein